MELACIAVVVAKRQKIERIAKRFMCVLPLPKVLVLGD